MNQRGGNTWNHSDGWGIAFYEGKGIRSFHDSSPSAESEIADMVQHHPIKSEIALCHIRQANVGDVCLANTHPFIREMWGQNWVFAHNGQIKDFVRRDGFYESIGDTDSESIFCDVMNQVRQTLTRDATVNQLADCLVALAKGYTEQGVFNCLLSNGDWLFTFCSTKLACITRRAPFGPACLTDADVSIDFAAETTNKDVVSIIATQPLTSDEAWEVYQPGEWRLWQTGEVVAQGIV